MYTFHVCLSLETVHMHINFFIRVRADKPSIDQTPSAPQHSSFKKLRQQEREHRL